ncbi:MAG: ribonuclease HIII [Erysipelotrichaceae bacterium]|nr:ribonuclease HIII [Erysipelotrichaceae bacterium]MDY5252345.1 ribonuclease HIII [Erysipelotrichaceae bacterium]
MNTITLTLQPAQAAKLYETFKEGQVPSTNQYVRYMLKLENCTITCYTSNKVVFQGSDAQVYASAFMDEKKLVVSKQPEAFQEHAGSDEVGTGDYFGPVVVAACIVKSKDLPWLQAENITDSKKLSDEYILKIAPKLLQQLTYTILILNNDKYNTVHQSNNLNAIKAKLHNQAYLNLSKKQSLPKLVVIDQFTPSKNYYQYLSQEPEVIGNIHFETKAESKYLAVACASIIARYAFLIKWQEMEKRYAFTFHKGASSLVDQDIQAFIKQFGYERLHEVAKLHFKNTPAKK